MRFHALKKEMIKDKFGIEFRSDRDEDEGGKARRRNKRVHEF